MIDPGYLAKAVRLPKKEQQVFLYMTLDESNGEASVLEYWVMWSTTSLLLLLVPLYSVVVESIRFPSMAQIELFNHLQCLWPFSCVQTDNYY